MVYLRDLLDTLQIEALANKLSPTEESIYRSICRTYSEKFNTPLHKVLELDPELVILNVYESQMEDLDHDERIEDILETIQSIKDPNYIKKSKEEMDLFEKLAIKEEAERLSIKKEKVKEHPKEGFLDVSKFDPNKES